MKFRIIAAFVLGASIAGLAQRGAGSKGRTYVSTPGVEKVSVVVGGRVPVEFPFEVEQGFHINSSQPSTEELIPTSIAFTAPSDLVISHVQYPPGELMSFAFDPQTKLNVYSGKFIIKATVLAPAKVGTGAHTVHGELTYQACDNRACYPPKKLPVEFVVNVSKPKRGARPNRQSPHVH